MSALIAVGCYAVLIVAVLFLKFFVSRSSNPSHGREYGLAVLGSRPRHPIEKRPTSEFWAAFTGAPFAPPSNGTHAYSPPRPLEGPRPEEMPHEFKGLLEEDDISPVIKNLRPLDELPTGVSPNDPYTRALIAAGVSLIRKEYRVKESDDGEQHGFLSWLSTPAVVGEARNLVGGFIDGGAIHERWPGHNHYVADLIRYSLWVNRWQQDVEEAGLATSRIREAIEKNDDIVAVVHETAYRDVVSLASMSSYRFQMMAAAAAQNNPVVKHAITDMYATILSHWTNVYQAVIDGLGLELRPGIKVSMIADALAGTAEGVAIRVLADPDSSVIDHQRRTTVLGSVALGIMISWIDAGDGASLEQLVRQAYSDRRGF